LLLFFCLFRWIWIFQTCLQTSVPAIHRPADDRLNVDTERPAVDRPAVDRPIADRHVADRHAEDQVNLSGSNQIKFCFKEKVLIKVNRVCILDMT